MEVGKTLYTADRNVWRRWLAKNHKTAKDIWLIYYKKDSGKKRIPYHEAVEEALCYGWIDSITKRRDEKSYVQRFSPRKPNSVLSGINRERIYRLIRAKKMTKAGLASIAHHLDSKTQQPKKFVFPKDILNEIRKKPVAWKNYQRFPLSYRNIRIEWIEGARNRPEIFQKRLKYFIATAEKNKRFGMEQ